MNIPFGLPAKKETATKKKEVTVRTDVLLEKRLEDYRDTLEHYKNFILEYSNKIISQGKSTSDNQLINEQTTMDITYLKEQEDKVVNLLNDLIRSLQEIKTEAIIKSLSSTESMSASLADMSLKLESLDKNVVNRLSELLLELQKQTFYQNNKNQTELVSYLDNLTLKVKKGHSFLWVLFTLNIFGLGVLAFLALYVLGILPF